MKIPFLSKLFRRNSNASTNNYDDPDLTGGSNNAPIGAIADPNYSGFPVNNSNDVENSARPDTVSGGVHDSIAPGLPGPTIPAAAIPDTSYSGFPIVGDPSIPETTGGDSNGDGITDDGSTAGTDVTNPAPEYEPILTKPYVPEPSGGAEGNVGSNTGGQTPPIYVPYDGSTGGSYNGFPIVGDPSMPDTTGGDTNGDGVTDNDPPVNNSNDVENSARPDTVSGGVHDSIAPGLPVTTPVAAIPDTSYNGFPIVGDPSMPDTTGGVVNNPDTDGSPRHFDPPQPDSVNEGVVSIPTPVGTPTFINPDLPDNTGGNSIDGGVHDNTSADFPNGSDYTYPPSTSQDTNGAIASDVTSDYDNTYDGVSGGLNNDYQDPGGDGTATDNQTSQTNTDPLNITENGGNVDTTS